MSYRRSVQTDPMPIDAVLPEITDALGRAGAVVVQAPPGAGKTTRVPFAIQNAGLLGAGQLVMLEPRRMAARAAARTMARMHGKPVGDTVGYQVRFDRCLSEKTRILVVTEGILTQRFLTDPFLDGITCVVLDEFHERSVHADLALAFLRELRTIREELRVAVMSATLDPEPVSAFLGCCPIVTCTGRAYPLTVAHAPRTDDRPLPVRVAAGLARLLNDDRDDGGDILVFLPGAGEIERTAEHLAGLALRGDPELVPLYGALPPEAQDRALMPGSGRRIVLATNIAESSLTVPGVTAVVDAGLVKRVRSDPASGLDRLERVAISQESAAQRAGRAGRTAPGRVVRLWTETAHRSLRVSEQPEIRRVDLAPVLLHVLAFHPGDVRAFGFFEPPLPGAIAAALKLLGRLGAITPGAESLSDRGKALARLPLHPRLGAILLRSAQTGLGQTGARIAAMLEEGEILLNQDPEHRTGPDIDLHRRLALLASFARRGGSPRAAQQLGLHRFRAENALRSAGRLAALANQLTANRPGSNGDESASEEALGRLILSGFPDRVCRPRAPGSAEAIMVGGRAVAYDPRANGAPSNLFIAVEADASSPSSPATGRVHLAIPITREALGDACPELLHQTHGARFDAKTESVKGVETLLFDDLVLDERPSDAIPADLIAATLFAEARGALDRVFQPSRNAAELRDRLLFAARTMPEERWPDVGDRAILGLIETACLGKRSFEELRRIDWARALSRLLDHRHRELLDTEAPPTIRLPSGRQARIDYRQATGGAGAPVLAARIQELFGLTQTPRIARGRVTLLLHLLAPNGRPAQITQDIESFWKNTYPEVRRALRGRYPKHAWPENPFLCPHYPD